MSLTREQKVKILKKHSKPVNPDAEWIQINKPMTKDQFYKTLESLEVKDGIQLEVKKLLPYLEDRHAAGWIARDIDGVELSPINFKNAITRLKQSEIWEQ